MSWLLKIVEGPMKGAEIALVSGLKVKVGSADTCDVVIADGALAAEAFELDVTDGGVLLAAPGQPPRTLPAFEIADFGTTAIAVGPAEGRWEPLTRRPAEPSPESGADAAKPEAKETEVPPAPEGPAGKERRRRGVGCLVWLLLLLLIGFLIWWFWPRIAEKWPSVETTRQSAVARVRAWCGGSRQASAEPIVPPKPAGEVLAELAAAHALSFETSEGRHLLRGNVARRTERLAIRALAQAADPAVAFDLTDDETLKKASEEFLFGATEGAIKVVSASNRVVVLKGYAPTREKLERAIRALDQDVPGVARVVTDGIQVGGRAPDDAAKSAFAAGAKPAPNAPAPHPTPKVSRDYPIAGILSQPYPCVVMRTGLRLTEGAQIGTAVLEKIAPDHLVLREGKTTFEWRP